MTTLKLIDAELTPLTSSNDDDMLHVKLFGSSNTTCLSISLQTAREIHRLVRNDAIRKIVTRANYYNKNGLIYPIAHFTLNDAVFYLRGADNKLIPVLFDDILDEANFLQLTPIA